jgi:Ca-activated chloride channel family protein
VDRFATEGVRLFSFGVGYDVNTLLLDTISQEHRGTSAYVEPRESIESEVASFYTKISAPLLSDVRLSVEGVEITDWYPDPLPDLFAGSQLLVVGRYRESGTARVTLEGLVNGRSHTFVYPSVRLNSLGGQEFIPQLWATRKVGYLLREIRLHGENAELVEEIIALSVRYGIMTPYTSFLVDEAQDILTEAGRRDLAATSKLAAPTAMPMVGAEAVADSQVNTSLVQSERGGGAESSAIQVVASRAFVLRDGIWTDTAYDPEKMRVRRIQFGSDDYFELLAQHPEWGRYVALGEQVIFVTDAGAYQVGLHAPGPVETSWPDSQTPLQRLLDWLRSIAP